MIQKPLDATEQSDIEALLTNRVVELTTLDYKRDLPGTDYGTVDKLLTWFVTHGVSPRARSRR